MPGPAFRHNLEYTRRWTTAHYDYWYFCANVIGMVFIVFLCLMEQNVITRHFANLLRTWCNLPNEITRHSTKGMLQRWMDDIYIYELLLAYEWSILNDKKLMICLIFVMEFDVIIFFCRTELTNRGFNDKCPEKSVYKMEVTIIINTFYHINHTWT